MLWFRGLQEEPVVTGIQQTARSCGPESVGKNTISGVLA